MNEPEYVFLNGRIVRIDQIVAVSKSEDGFSVYLSGTREIKADSTEGKFLWDYLSRKAVTPDRLP